MSGENFCGKCGKKIERHKDLENDLNRVESQKTVQEQNIPYNKNRKMYNFNKFNIVCVIIIILLSIFMIKDKINIGSKNYDDVKQKVIAEVNQFENYERIAQLASQGFYIDSRGQSTQAPSQEKLTADMISKVDYKEEYKGYKIYELTLNPQFTVIGWKTDTSNQYDYYKLNGTHSAGYVIEWRKTSYDTIYAGVSEDDTIVSYNSISSVKTLID